MSDNPSSTSAGEDVSQTTPAGQTSPPKDQSDQSTTAQLTVQPDDPALSLRQKALLTLRRKPLASSHSSTATPTLPQRPALDTPTLTLDYGQEEPSVATSVASKPSNGLQSSTSVSQPAPVPASANTSIPLMSRTDLPKKPEQPPAVQPSTPADISMREEGEISDEEPEPEPKPSPKAPASRKAAPKSSGGPPRKAAKAKTPRLRRPHRQPRRKRHRPKLLLPNRLLSSRLSQSHQGRRWRVELDLRHRLVLRKL